MGNPHGVYPLDKGARMRKVQCSIKLTVLDGATLPDGVPEGGTVVVTSYADGRDLTAVMDEAVRLAIDRVRAVRSGEGRGATAVDLLAFKPRYPDD